MAMAISPVDLSTHFQVRVSWATRHQWTCGETLAQTPLHGYALWLLEAGELQVETPTQTQTLRAGDALLWPPDLHRVIRAGNGDAITPGAQWLTIGLHAQLFGHLDILHLLPVPYAWTPDAQAYSRLKVLMQSICAPSESTAGVLLRDGLCRAIVALLWQTLRDDDLLLAARQTLPDWLQKALAFAHNEPGASVSELARTAAFSPAQFRRAFAQWMEISPRDYLQNQRLELARKLLENSELPISSIAEQAHFGDISHFGRTWKKFSGLSPTAYRRASRSPHSRI